MAKQKAKYVFEVFVEFVVIVGIIGAAGLFHYFFWDSFLGWLYRNIGDVPGYTGYTAMWFVTWSLLPFFIVGIIRWRRSIKSSADMTSKAFESLGRITSEMDTRIKNMDGKLGEFVKASESHGNKLLGMVESIDKENDKTILALTNSVSVISKNVDLVTVNQKRMLDVLKLSEKESQPAPKTEPMPQPKETVEVEAE